VSVQSSPKRGRLRVGAGDLALVKSEEQVTDRRLLSQLGYRVMPSTCSHRIGNRNPTLSFARGWVHCLRRLFPAFTPAAFVCAHGGSRRWISRNCAPAQAAAMRICDSWQLWSIVQGPPRPCRQQLLSHHHAVIEHEMRRIMHLRGRAFIGKPHITRCVPALSASVTGSGAARYRADQSDELAAYHAARLAAAARDAPAARESTLQR
jgi:hypothetical protein